MKTKPSGPLPLLVTLLLLPGWAAAQDELADEGVRQLSAIQAAMRRAIDRARPSVASVFLVERADVGIRSNPLGIPNGDQQTDLDSSRFHPYGFGSGIVVEPDGRVLTCYHVVRSVLKEPRHQIVVRLSDGRQFEAQLYSGDPRSDLAIIRLISPEPLDLTPIAIADGGALAPADFVLALGNPYGTAARDGSISASMGIVSNLRRRPAFSDELHSDVSIQLSGTLIQTDARLNTGISGGALINIQGELVGITAALSAAIGFETPGGFAIPTDTMIRRVIAQLNQGREVEYGFIGITPATIRPTDAAREGALPVQGTLVQQIHLPAAKRAGLRERDIVVAINGRPITNQDELILAVGALPVGEIFDMEVVRGQSRLHLKIPVAKYPIREGAFATVKRPDWNGIRVDHVSTALPQLISVFEAREFNPQGVVVREVEDGSSAYDKGIRQGQFIVAVNGQPVTDPDHFEKLTSETPLPVRLRFQDGRDTTEVVFEAEPDPEPPATGKTK